MRHASRLVLLTVTALALGALTVTAASATGLEWLENTHGVYKPVSGAMAVRPVGTIKVHELEGLLDVKCEVALEGSIEANGAGKITGFNFLSCSGGEKCTEPISISVQNLPWKTEAYVVGTEDRERIVSGGSGTPGVLVTCKTSFGNQEDNCNLNTSAKMVNTGTGGAEAVFDSSSEKTECKKGFDHNGEVTGDIVYPRPQYSEGIEVKSEEKKWVWAHASGTITGSVNTKSKGKVALTDKSIGVESECEAAGEGVAEPGGVGSDTKWTLTGCKVTKGSGTCLSAEVEALHLPWHLELTESSGPHEVITNGGSGEPGFKRTCNTVLGKVSDIMTAKKLETALENVSGGVNSTFVWPGEWLTCTLGKECSAEGTQLVESTAGGTLEVS